MRNDRLRERLSKARFVKFADVRARQFVDDVELAWYFEGCEKRSTVDRQLFNVELLAGLYNDECCAGFIPLRMFLRKDCGLHYAFVRGEHLFHHIYGVRDTHVYSVRRVRSMFKEIA